MTLNPKPAIRISFLTRVVRKECEHLAITDRRLFADNFTMDTARRLETDVDLAERVEAFVGRFGRLQDTLGDKLLAWGEDGQCYRQSGPSRAPGHYPFCR